MELVWYIHFTFVCFISRLDHDGVGILRTVDILASLGVSIEDQCTPIGRPVLSALPGSSKERKFSSTIRSSSVKTLPAINTDINKSNKSNFKGLGAAVITTAEEDNVIINSVSKVLSVKYNELLTELKTADPLCCGLVCYYCVCLSVCLSVCVTVMCAHVCVLSVRCIYTLYSS